MIGDSDLAQNKLPHVRVFESPMGLSVEINSQSKFLGIIDLFFTLVVFPAVYVFLVQGMLADPKSHLPPWIGQAVLIVAVLFTLLQAVWHFAGTELITVGSGTLTLSHKAFGVGRERRYDLTRIFDLRVTSDLTVSAEEDRARRTSHWTWGFAGGLIAFTYGRWAVRFGAGLDDPECFDLVKLLIAREPLLGKTAD